MEEAGKQKYRKFSHDRGALVAFSKDGKRWSWPANDIFPFLESDQG